MQHVDEGTLHAYLDARDRPDAGALDAEACARVERHLAGCVPCAAALADAERVRVRAGDVLLGAAPHMPDLPAFPSLEVPAARSPRRTWVPLAWAASVLLAAGAGWMGSGLWRAEAGRLVPTESGPAATAPAARPAPADASDAGADAALDTEQQSPATGATASAASPDIAPAPAATGAGASGRAAGAANQLAARPEADAVVAPPPTAAPAAATAVDRAGVAAAVEDARVASEKARETRALVEPQRTTVQFEALGATGAVRSYPGDDDVAWSAIGLADARRLLADTLLLVPDAAVEQVARDPAGRVRVRQRDAAGEIELVQWRAAGQPTEARPVRGTAADGQPFVLVARGGSTVALRAPAERLEALVERLARHRP